jgi:hypothetical protein
MKTTLPQAFRNKKITICLSTAEYERLCQEYALSACRKKSEHHRYKLLGQPVQLFDPGFSPGELIPLLVGIRQELLQLEGNYRNSEQESARLDQLAEAQDLEGCWSRDRERLFILLGIIHENLEKIACAWSVK